MNPLRENLMALGASAATIGAAVPIDTPASTWQEITMPVILAGVYKLLKWKREPFAPYVTPNADGKVKVGIQRRAGYRFPASAAQYEVRPTVAFKPSNIYIRVATLDPKADDADEALVEAIHRSKTAIKEFLAYEDPQDQLVRRGQRLLKSDTRRKQRKALMR